MLQKLVSFLEYFLVVLLIIEFNTPYIQFHIVSAGVSLAVASILIVLFALGKKSVAGVSVAVLLIIGALPPILFVEKGFLVPYIKNFIIIFPLFYLYLCNIQNNNRLQHFMIKASDLVFVISIKRNNNRLQYLMFKFSDVVFVISIISLFFWTFGSLMGLIEANLWIPNDWAGPRMIPSYYGLYFETQEAGFMGEHFLRNTGIFNEAPMYNMILCFAFSIEYFMKDKRNGMRIIIYLLTILSTLSTTGLFYILIVISYKKITWLWKKNKLVLLFGSVVFLFLFILISSILLDSKMENGGEGSVTRRSEDIFMCLNVGLENPLIGVGLFHDSNLEWGTSNSLFTLFAHGGIYVLSMYMFSLLLIPLYYLKSRNDAKVLFGYFILFTFTITLYNFLTIFLVAWGLSTMKSGQGILARKTQLLSKGKYLLQMSL